MKNGSSKCCLYFHLFFVANTKIIFGYNIATPLYKHLLNSLLMQKQSPEVFHKKSVLRNFAKFTEKHLCQSLFFNKVAGLRQLCQRLWHRWFAVNFAKCLRTPFLQNTSGRLLLLMEKNNIRSNLIKWYSENTVTFTATL